jgi:hypothetical protein
MLSFIGIRRDAPELRSTEAYIHELRRGRRLAKLGNE